MDDLPPLFEGFSPLFDDFRGMNSAEKACFVIAVGALEAGLEVRFLRKFPGGPDRPPEGWSLSRMAITGGGRTEEVHASAPRAWINRNNALAARDKLLTKVILDRAGINTPFGGAAKAGNTAILDTMRKAGLRRVILKPARGSRSRGVIPRLSLEEAGRVIASVPQVTFLVEQQLDGQEYRILVLDGRIVCAAERLVPTVVGNGAFDIARLLETENAFRARHPEYFHRLIEMEEARAHLARRGDWLERVPAMGERVELDDSDMSRRATATVDCGDRLPAHVGRAAVRAAEALKVRWAGIDVRLDGKGRPYILELNQRPGIGSLSTGYRRDRWWPGIARAVVGALFPGAHPVAEVERLAFAEIREAFLAPGAPDEIAARGYVRFAADAAGGSGAQERVDT